MLRKYDAIAHSYMLPAKRHRKFRYAMLRCDKFICTSSLFTGCRSIGADVRKSRRRSKRPLPHANELGVGGACALHCVRLADTECLVLRRASGRSVAFERRIAMEHISRPCHARYGSVHFVTAFYEHTRVHSTPKVLLRVFSVYLFSVIDHILPSASKIRGKVWKQVLKKGEKSGKFPPKIQ